MNTETARCDLNEGVRMTTSLNVGLAAGGLFLIGAAMLLWARFGERVFFDNLIAGIAGCF